MTQLSFAQTNDINLWMQSVALIETGPAFCSAVSLDETTLATAYHCVSSTEKIHIQWEDDVKSTGIVSFVNPKRDLAIISLENPIERSYYPSISTTNPIRGEQIFAMGHPYAPYANRPKMEGTLLWSVSTGIISQVGTTFLQTDAALNPGNSGGPTFNEKGNIVGIASRKLQGENLSFLAPASALDELLKQESKPSWWGGSWGLSISSLIPFDASLQSTNAIEVNAAIRKYIHLQTSFGRPLVLDSKKSYVVSSTNATIKKGFGHGSSYATIGVGGGLSILSSQDILPQSYLQFEFGGSTLGYHLLFLDNKPILAMKLSINYPGTLGIF